MKANELMIGDFVNVTCKFSLVNSNLMKTLPKKGRVVGLDDESVWVDFTELGFLFEDIEPIPLTPEILEKNFQEFLPGINLMYQLKGPYCAMNEDGQWVFGLVKVDGENRARYPLVKISFVHELQNALRLCGIEKEIKL